MKVERCNNCGKVRNVILHYGEQRAGLIEEKDKCRCSNKFENESTN